VGPSVIMASMSTRVPEPRDRPIAVFDSGVGGLTVLQDLLVELPHEDFLYLGDTARFPYGERSASELERFALEIGELLLMRRAKLLVVACNAASAAALPALRERMFSTTLGVEVVGVIEPESRLAATSTRTGRIGLLATTATVRSGAYARALAAHAPDALLTSVPCPDLAPIIQQGFPFDRRVVDTVRSYCLPLREAGVDTVILGCTHYPLIAPMLQRMLGPEVRLVTSGRSLAQTVAGSLEHAQLGSTREGEGDYRFLCTGDLGAFREVGSRFLQMPIEEIEQISLPLAEAA
jgi:glutamate racemase